MMNSALYAQILGKWSAWFAYREGDERAIADFFFSATSDTAKVEPRPVLV